MAMEKANNTRLYAVHVQPLAPTVTNNTTEAEKIRKNVFVVFIHLRLFIVCCEGEVELARWRAR